MQARWTIKARCSQKSDVRRYSNQRGEGRVFSFDLVDKDNGEIRCTGFNDQCDKFHPMIEEGKVYTLTKGSVRPKRQGNVRPLLACGLHKMHHLPISPASVRSAAANG